MSVLNDLEALRALDPSNMYNTIFDLPEQMAKAQKMASGWNVPAEEFPDIRNVVVVGMGGSAIGGDLARTYLAGEMLVPFTVCRNYQLPEFVDDETLVIASSYSGNTEETLAAVDDALDRKAMMAVLTSGGLLEEVARLNEIPMLVLPGGLQPRAAIGFSFVPLMMFLEKVGLVKDVQSRLKTAISALQSWRDRMVEDQPDSGNPAKQLAQLLHGKIPIIYGGPVLTDVVAMRWKTQICENSKAMAFCNVYPEFNHNEICGWSKLTMDQKDGLIVINLRSGDDHERIAARMDAVKRIIEEQDVMVIDLWAAGESRLERMLNLIQMGDFVSYYLAILNETDPTPVSAIEDLKKELAAEAEPAPEESDEEAGEETGEEALEEEPAPDAEEEEPKE